jgi:hypothetical protein
VLDGKSGRTKCDLGKANESANCEAIKKTCPELLNQFILFGPRLTRNGIELSLGTSSIDDPRAWILGGSVLSHVEVEDFYELRDLAGRCGIRSFPLTPNLNLTDAWNGQAMGHHRKQNPCHYFGHVLGQYKGRILTTYTVKKSADDAITTLVTLPMSGPPVAEPVPCEYSSVSGFFNPLASISAQEFRTTLGFLLLNYESLGESRFQEHVLLLSETGIVAQPLPSAKLPKGFVGWWPTAACRDGVIYYAQSDMGEASGRQRIACQPYETRTASARI